MGFKVQRPTAICLGFLLLVSACGDRYVPPGSDPVVVIGGEGGMAGSAEVSVGTPSGPLLEGGEPVTAFISLKKEPAASVQLGISSSDPLAGTIAPSLMEFTPETWENPQVLTLTPGDDDIASGDREWRVEFMLTSEDPDFQGKPVGALRVVTIDDDVAPSIVATPRGELITTEEGGTVTVEVILSRQPTNDVLVPVTVSKGDEATVSPSTLSFSPLDWNVPQAVIVTGVDDGEADGDAMYELRIGPANSMDEAFNGIGPKILALVNTDGVCGNGVVDGMEACEPIDEQSVDCEFGEQSCKVCSSACELVDGSATGWCGDGVVQAEEGEECDSPLRPCAYGETSCEVCGRECRFVEGATSGWCGDGVVQESEGEACDGVSGPECPQGMASCVVCDDTCAEVPGQPVSWCGDGIVQPEIGEECEGTAECPLGFGVASCALDCTIDESQCTTIIGVEAASRHSCAMFSDGSVECWGSSGVNVPPSNTTGVIDLIADRYTTCVIRTGGNFECWGQGGLSNLSAVSVSMLALDNTQYSANSPSTVTVCALTSGGQINCDTNSIFRTGFLNNTPQNSGWSYIAVGDTSACALTSSRAVACWDDVNSYELPNAYFSMVEVTTIDVCGIFADSSIGCFLLRESTKGPLTAPSKTGYIDIDMATRGNFDEVFACAVNTAGIDCWGDVPTGVPAYIPGSFTQVSTGQDHICATQSSGTAQCWGSNSHGQLNAP